MDEIDSILSDEKVIRPSDGFAARVMVAVREEAAVPPPIEFPWKRFVSGIGTAVTLTFATFIALAQRAETSVPPFDTDAWLELLVTPTGQGLLIATGAVLASLATAWFAVRGSGASGSLNSF